MNEFLKRMIVKIMMVILLSSSASAIADEYENILPEVLVEASCPLPKERSAGEFARIHILFKLVEPESKNACQVIFRYEDSACIVGGIQEECPKAGFPNGIDEKDMDCLIETDGNLEICKIVTDGNFRRKKKENSK